MATKDVSVVLAHGAWADGSSWARVVAALKEESVKVSAAPLPLTSLADDVAALNRSLDRTSGPVVLVGHAYAGAVMNASDGEHCRQVPASWTWHAEDRQKLRAGSFPAGHKRKIRADFLYPSVRSLTPSSKLRHRP